MKSKNEYIKIVKSNIKNKKSKELLLKQIDNYYLAVDNYKSKNHQYKK